MTSSYYVRLAQDQHFEVWWVRERGRGFIIAVKDPKGSHIWELKKPMKTDIAGSGPLDVALVMNDKRDVGTWNVYNAYVEIDEVEMTAVFHPNPPQDAPA